MRNYIFLIAILTLSACVAAKNSDTKTLKLTKADSQSYVLGKDKGDGKTSGTAYSMYFENKNKIEVLRVWIHSINMDFEQIETSAEGSFRLRSTVYGGTQSNQHPYIKAPIEYTGQALVEYKENNEIKYYIVSEFKTYEKVTGYK